MRAYDNGVPERENITTVTVNVNRNLKCPRWKQGHVTSTIMETLDIASMVAQVVAEDRDNQVGNYRY